MSAQISGWKVLTHELRPPIQGGAPVWDGTPGAVLVADRLDRGDAECGAGINFTRDPGAALRIAGLWPDGYPSRLLRVTTDGEWIERGDKVRTERLIIEREATEAELRSAIEALSVPFGEHAPRMVESQLAWREALARSEHKPRLVAADLRRAFDARGLEGWTARRYPDPAWVAWDAQAARDAWAAWAAWAAWDARAAWAARAAWDAWAARDAWAAWAAWAAWDALTVEYAALCGWIDRDPLLLTTGLREAYAHGLGIAVPVAPKVLGWAMEAGE